jgi:hypothetical protein
MGKVDSALPMRATSVIFKILAKQKQEKNRPIRSPWPGICYAYSLNFLPWYWPREIGGLNVRFQLLTCLSGKTEQQKQISWNQTLLSTYIPRHLLWRFESDCFETIRNLFRICRGIQEVCVSQFFFKICHFSVQKLFWKSSKFKHYMYVHVCTCMHMYIGRYLSTFSSSTSSCMNYWRSRVAAGPTKWLGLYLDRPLTRDCRAQKPRLYRTST